MAALSVPPRRASAGLTALFALDDAAFRGADASLHYATARYLCMWLDERGELWPFYRAWRDGVSGDPTGARAFTAVVGETPREADGEWARWVMK